MPDNLSAELAQVAAQAAARRYARPVDDHVSLGAGLRFVVFLAVAALGTLLAGGLGSLLGGVGGGASGLVFGAMLAVPAAAYASRVLRIAAQWEQAVVLRFGKFHRIAEAGIVLVFPVADYVRFVDRRILTMDIPRQQVITKDNVPVRLDGVIFFQVRDPERAVITIQDYRFAISQYAQAALRDVVGAMSLDDLLAERDEIQRRISEAVEQRSQAWGIHVDSIRLLDIDMPEDLKRMMSRQASAEREKRATITKAEGDRDAALNLAQAATTMATSPGAMQLRTLQTLDALGASQSNTVVLGVPVEVLELARGLMRAGPDKPHEPRH